MCENLLRTMKKSNKSPPILTMNTAYGARITVLT